MSVARYHVQTMYNIKQAAARAGVSVPVLRAWERRYGIVHPARSASGYRRFDEADVARVRTMRELVDEGWSPSAASAAILAGSVAVPSETAPAEAVVAARGAPAGDAPDLAGRLVAAARELDAGALEVVLDDLFSRGSFERVVDDLLFPALRDLGEAWASGEVSVAGEHLASGAVLRRLGLALDGAARAARGPRVVVGLPPGSRHELGALAFAVAARRVGMDVAYVGADLPAPDWVAATAQVDAAVIGVPTRQDRRAALDVTRALRKARPSLSIALGGGAAPAAAGTIRLPDTLPEAVDALAEALIATT